MGGKRLLLWNVPEIREEDSGKEQRLKQRDTGVRSLNPGVLRAGMGLKAHPVPWTGTCSGPQSFGVAQLRVPRGE